jgi:tetratricopeptide (TPR) repeat protein
VAEPDGLVGVELGESPDRPGAELAVKVLIDLALKYQDRLMGRPGRLEVVEGDFGAAVVEALGDPEVAFDIVPELTKVKAVLRSFAEHEQDGPPVPDLLSPPGVTLDDVRQYAEAAERFYRAEPWQYLTNDDLLTVELPGLDKRARYATVMGNAGLQYGVVLHASPKDVEALAGGSVAKGGTKTYWSVTYSKAEEIPFCDLELWEDHRLPLGSDEAYPLAMGFGRGELFERPSRTLLHNYTAILAALADTIEQEIDSGHWTKRVAVGGDHFDVTLTLPNVCEPEADTQPRRSPADAQRANERFQAEIGRFLADKDFGSIDEMNAAVQAQFVGRKLDDVEHTASTPLERAQDLVYEAFESVGRRRVILARRALELSPDCADAYVVLAEEAAGPARARPLYEAGVAAAERALGLEVMTREVGQFWSVLDTRPYMRARLGLAQTLVDLDRVDEAVGHYRELLRLNPNDNQGVRHLLLAELVLAHRDDEARALLQEYKDDIMAAWPYTWALVEFRNGHRAEALALATRALEMNPHVPETLALDLEERPPIGESMAVGSLDEAIDYVDQLGDAWHETPGAVEWLQQLAAAHRRGPKGPRRARRRT